MMIFNKNSFKILSPTDLVVIVFYLFLITINLVFHNQIDQWVLLVSLDFLLIFFVVYLAYKSDRTKHKIWENMHFYYVVPLIFLSFKEVYVLLESIHAHDYDQLLITADRLIFGTDPTVVLYKIANPVLTEILQIAYGTFFILPVILGVEFQLKHKML